MAYGVMRTTLDVDVVADLRVNAAGLDLAYRRRWAGNLGLDELLGVALRSITADRS